MIFKRKWPTSKCIITFNLIYKYISEPETYSSYVNELNHYLHYSPGVGLASLIRSFDLHVQSYLQVRLADDRTEVHLQICMYILMIFLFKSSKQI